MPRPATKYTQAIKFVSMSVMADREMAICLELIASVFGLPVASVRGDVEREKAGASVRPYRPGIAR